MGDGVAVKRRDSRFCVCYHVDMKANSMEYLIIMFAESQMPLLHDDPHSPDAHQDPSLKSSPSSDVKSISASAPSALSNEIRLLHPLNNLCRHSVPYSSAIPRNLELLSLIFQPSISSRSHHRIHIHSTTHPLNTFQSKRRLLISYTVVLFLFHANLKATRYSTFKLTVIVERPISSAHHQCQHQFQLSQPQLKVNVSSEAISKRRRSSRLTDYDASAGTKSRRSQMFSGDFKRWPSHPDFDSDF
ncbi:hypothetical protein SCHPADRAFT_615445 [Schizopora paradoxa]|uniref:Uncharacterized protein n=1 Tax=Schizopora paradoxa TaxID=27342 RepID=A0A0H2RFC6_9AGAM|nr:hypothetical protein SCHPADRAFT_615445 [Schizopora paradoxa]